MKRKSKRKKDSNSPKTPEISRKNEAKQRKDNDFQQVETGGRDSSQRTRSLSSLFRRSRDRQRSARSGSSDRSKSRGTSSGGTELADPHAAFNPRTEPRDHLRRMTVREALADSRTRGRSPNRRAINNLEKRMMDSGPTSDQSSEKSLSTSLPHIPDQLPANNHDMIDNSDSTNSKAMTLDRSGKQRGYSEGKISINEVIVPKNEPQSKDDFLPLDKRKYIINKDDVKSDSTKPLRPATNQLHLAEIHTPHSSRDPSPYSASAFAYQERHRRESFARFLQLRDTRPTRSASSLSIGRHSTDSHASSDDHTTLLQSLSESSYVPPGNVSVLEDGTKVILPTYDEAMAEQMVPIGRKTISSSPASRFRPVKSKTVDIGAIPKLKDNVIKNSNANDIDTSQRNRKGSREMRSNYVSPRRFSRGSRKRSDSPNRSVETKEPQEMTIVADQVQSCPESVPTRYRRTFSSSSEKNKRKISNQSDVITPEADIRKVNEERFQIANPASNPHPRLNEYSNEKVNNLSDMYNNDILFPKPLQKQKTDDVKIGHEPDRLNEINDISDNNILNTGLLDVANTIQEAMKTVNTESSETQFPHNEFTAVPLASITDGIPFQVKTNNKDEKNTSEIRPAQSRSRSKSESVSKKHSSNSEIDPIHMDNVEDILMQDDVFETNIDEISLRSVEKSNLSDNHAIASDIEVSDKPICVHDATQHGSRHSSDSDKMNKKEEVNEDRDKIQKKGKEIQPKKESKKSKKKKTKTTDSENNKVEETPKTEDKVEDKKRKSKKVKKERRKSRSKSNRSMSDLGTEVSKLKELSESGIGCKQLENDKVVKIEDSAEKEAKPKTHKRKSFFRKSRRSVSRTASVKQALVRAGRAASLSDILGTPEIQRRIRKPSLVKSDSLQRSHSVEEISSLKYNKIEPSNCNMPDSIFNRRSAKDAIWNIQTQIPKPKDKERRSQPKLSLSAIISLRAKIGRYKKAKREKDDEQIAAGDTSPVVDTTNIECDDSADKEQPNENTEQCDEDVANIFYENEVNSSLNKQHDTNKETALIEDDLDNEIANIVHEKKIHFDPYMNDQQLSEEELIKQRQRNTRLTGRRESKVRQRQKKVISCCKKLIAFLFSHIGLCSLVVAYCIAGGFIFKNLEGKNELAKKKEMQTVRMSYTNQIFSLAFQNRFSKRSAKEFKIKVEEILVEYSLKIYRETKEAGWDGKDSTSEPEQWSFPSSLLYAITVMTTIGYGHVAPKTPVGRIVTIGYAVLGIPLTLLCLTNIGDVMAKGFRLLYGKVLCGLCCVLFRPPRKRRLHDPEKGLPAGEERMVVQEEEKSEELIHVPTSVCLLLMSAYVLLGTWAFCSWENWDMVTGTYFCFITLSTIGFGDVVPGMTSDKWDMNEKLVLCALYLILGLSLIAMCFNLVQEDVKAKCKWLGMKLGIIDKPVTSV